MKRRDFLAAGTFGIAGIWSGRAATRELPCAPSTVSVRGGTRTETLCSKPTVGRVPAWFGALKPLSWTPIAGGPRMSADWQSGDRLAEVVPKGPYFGGWGPRYITAGWNGACVDPVNREMITALTGGHSAWQYNDAYAISLYSDSPGWRRILDATPEVDPGNGRRYYDAVSNQSFASVPDGYQDAVVDQNNTDYLRPLLVPGWLNDGPHPEILYSDRNPDLSSIRRRPRTLHTCSHYHYSNGKVWYPIMNSWNQGTGPTSLVKLALDVDALRANPSLKAWRYGDPRPWSYLGIIDEQSKGDSSAFGFGVAALDPATGRIWYAGQKTSSYWSLETRGAVAGQHTFYNDAPRDKDLSSSAGAIASELPIPGGGSTSLFVFLEQGTFRIWVFEIPKAGTGQAWTSTVPSNASTFEWAAGLRVRTPDFTGHTAAYGMVYHERSKCFFAYNCDQLPNRSVLRRLAIPLHNDGTYDRNGSWAWNDVSVAGEPPDMNNPTAAGIGGGGGSYTRFNILPDFAGTGEDLLLHLSHFDKPTYVCKLPAAMIS